MSQIMNLDFTKPGVLLLVAGGVFSTMLLRYFLITGASYLVVWKLLRDRLRHRRIQSKAPTRRRVQREALWSISSFAIFTLAVVGLLAMSNAGWTRQYENISDRGWGYWVLSFAMMVFVHDAYFYWAHRFMHLKKVIRVVHAVHHKSFNPSPWALYAFHPIEAIIQTGVIYLIAFTIPFHLTALYALLVLMGVTGTVTHLGYELMPRSFARHPIGRWFCTSVHHNMHHHTGRHNYGLYFNFWDRLMGTNDATYEATFETVTAHPLVQRTRRSRAQSVVPMMIDGAAPGPRVMS